MRTQRLQLIRGLSFLVLTIAGCDQPVSPIEVTRLADVQSTSPNQKPSGRLDGVSSEGSVYGWSYDPDTAWKASSVHLYFDALADSGKTPVPVTAGDFREDIGSHAFNYVLPDQYRDGRAHTVYAYGLDLNETSGASTVLLPGSPISFTFGSLPLPAPAPLPSNQKPSGRLDGVAPDGVVYGWSYDPDIAWMANSVHLYFDGLAGTGKTPVAVTAGDFRADIGSHAFNSVVADQYRDGKPHTVYAYGLDLNDTSGASAVLLPGSPASFTFGSPTPAAPPPSPSSPLCNITPSDGQVAIGAAIQGCANGSTVIFPANQTYHQTDKIVVEGRSDLVIDGNGSTFIKTSVSVAGAARPNWHLAANTNLLVKNMVIQGSFVPPATRAAFSGNQFEHGFNIAGGSGITIQDVKITRVFGDFVTVAPNGDALQPVARNVRIERLEGRYAARQCVAPIGVVGFWLTDSKLSDCFQTGVDIEPDVAGELVQDVHILRNTITGTYFTAIQAPVKGAPGDVKNIEIRGNMITRAPDTCFPAVLITYPQNNVGNTTMLSGIVIEDNDLKTLSNGVVMQDVASGSVRNNRIENTAGNLCAPPTPKAVKLINSPNVLVSGNTMVGY
jgi:hypothetical protein